MKKFILVDDQCKAADQQHIEAGKYHMGDGDLDKSVAAILENDGYSIVKEIEMPAITAHHKLAFAIKAVGAIYDFPAYKDWAESWASGEARTVESVQGMLAKVDDEIAELEQMQEVAYSMGLDIDVEEVSKKQAQFERAKLVFHAAEAVA